GIMGGDRKKANALAEEIARIDPAAGFRAEARLAHEDKNTEREEHAFLRALQADPHDYQAEVSLASFYALQQHNQEQAEKHARAAIELDPERAEAHSILVGSLATQKRWADLDAALLQAERDVPEDFYPDYQAGRVLLLGASDSTRAERCFRKYLTQEPEGGTPDLGAAHWRLGLVLEKEGRLSEAVAELQTAVRLNPGLPEAKKDLKRLQ
ncbi:MAG TPA: tetratricopeptide repeat protein, partial [Vicinamibacteria bacterium]|nr:tetratricopeptide repeat protein [Vicinamibacteria bacterium]